MHTACDAADQFTRWNTSFAVCNKLITLKCVSDDHRFVVPLQRLLTLVFEIIFFHVPSNLPADLEIEGTSASAGSGVTRLGFGLADCSGAGVGLSGISVIGAGRRCVTSSNTTAVSSALRFPFTATSCEKSLGALQGVTQRLFFRRD